MNASKFQDGIRIIQPDRREVNEDEIFGEENEDDIRDEEQNVVMNHPLLAAAKRLGRIKRDEIADTLVHLRANA